MWLTCCGVLSPGGVGALGGAQVPSVVQGEPVLALPVSLPRVGSSTATTRWELWDPAVGSSCSLLRPCPASVIPYMAYVTCQKPPKVLKKQNGATGLWPFLNIRNNKQ